MKVLFHDVLGRGKWGYKNVIDTFSFIRVGRKDVAMMERIILLLLTLGMFLAACFPAGDSEAPAAEAKEGGASRIL